MSNALPSLDTLFSEAVEITDAGDRAAYLARACPDDTLRRRVEALVVAHFRAGSFLGEPLTTTDVPDPADEPEAVIGHYKLRECLGEGGMGAVYVAEQTEPVRRRVALKVIKPGMDTREVVARFEAERQALALMDHPHIAKVFDGGATAAGRPYFVMELVRGLPITEYCDQAKLPAERRLRLFAQVCRAVQHAHQKGVIHRDLKPSNVLVTLHDGEPVPKVIDFGIAKAVNQPLTDKSVYTRFNQLVGTPLYMAPEQAELSGLDIDTRSDVYALGVLLYELLTGTTPFDAETLRQAGFDEMRRMIRKDEPPRPSARVSTLDAQARSTAAGRRGLDERQLSRLLHGDLDWMVMKALEKDRNRRYDSAGAFAADVERHVAHEPVEARPPSVGYRLRKFLRRKRATVAMAAVLGVAILAVIYGAAYTAWERVSRAQAAEQKSSESLAGARAAIEAGDLALADQRAAEAAGHIALYRNRLPDAAIAVDRVRYEIESRRAEANRFQSFLRQVADSYGTAHVDTRTYREQIGEIEAALNTYGVLAAADDWTDQLDKVYLTPTERGQVREVAYVGLVYLADYRMRWHRDDPRRSAQQSLENLRQAEAFHPPTRAFYFVRGECHRKLNDTAAAEADEKQFAQTPAVTAWDHFLPGHTAGWNGDIDEAIRSYRAALRVQPDHYPSLFFLAERLAKRKYEYAEAIGICTACIALRRDKVVGYLNRAECYANLGQLAEAEADYVSAYSTASNVYSRIGVVQALRKFHKETGREDKAKEDAARLVDLHTTLVADHRRDHGPAHEKTLSEMNNLAVALVDVGRLADALTQIEQAKKAARESGQKEPAYRVQNLAALYGRMGRHEDSIHLLTGLLKTCEATPNHPDLPETAHQLGHAYERANRPAEAVPFFERSLAKLKSRGDPERKKILEFSICLGRAYEPTGQSAKAIELFEPLLQQWTAKEGPDHEETIVLMDDLARAYDRGGRVADGIHLHERHVDKCKAKYGPKHTKTLVAMNNLALAYVDSERLPEAIALYEQTLTQRLALSGPDHSEAIVTASNLASAYLSVGRLEEAERKYRNILERRPEATPHANPNVIALSGLGRALLFQKRYREAETVLRECVAIQEKLMPTSWLRFYATSMLGGAIFEQGRHAEAEPLLLSGYEGIRQRERVLSPSGKKRLTEAGERIVRLYEATGRPDQAQDWRQKLPTPGPLPSK